VVFAELLPSVNELFVWKAWFGADTWYAFNKTTALAFLSTLICVAIFVVGARKRAMVPAGMQNVAEMGYEAIEEQIGVEVMGADAGKKWAPFLATLFFWIFFINIWSTFPGIMFPATSRLAIPLVLAMQTWAIFIIVCIKHQGFKYFINACFPPGVPWPLYFLVAPIEFISKFMLRPFSLAVRLFANMAAGHVLLALFAIMTNELIVVHASGLYQIPLGLLPFAALVAMVGFELLVALLQAYIFTILTAVYVNESLHAVH
jgi:F-type H+-transporting ATPase subunit a